MNDFCWDRVLNERLYNKLVKVFQKVHVTNRGCGVTILETVEWSHGILRKRSQFAPGSHEEYAVDCPFCGDKKHRLSFHYLWATEDYLSHQLRLHLVNCHNEDCVRNSDARRELYDMLFRKHWDNDDCEIAVTPDLIRRGVNGNPAGLGRRGKPAHDKPLPPPIKRSERRPLPDPLFAIIDKAVPNEAKDYLRARGFNLHELWARWRVLYCPEDLESVPALRQPRIIAPIYSPQPTMQIQERPTLAGWAARLAYELDPEERVRKYLFRLGMAKSELLYGWPGPIQRRGPIVACEGMTDVWRLGCNAVALLGKVASQLQQELLIQAAERRPLVVFLDNDAKKEAEKLVNLLRQRRRNIGEDHATVLATPPPGIKDVAELSRADAWQCIAAALRRSVTQLGIDYDAVQAPLHAKCLLAYLPKLPA